MKQKAFLIIFEWPSLQQIKNMFLKGESPTLTEQDKQGSRHKKKE